MDCGFLVENVILTFACIGFVAVLREIYIAYLWRKIGKDAIVKIFVSRDNQQFLNMVNKLKKWYCPQANITDETIYRE